MAGAVLTLRVCTSWTLARGNLPQVRQVRRTNRTSLRSQESRLALPAPSNKRSRPEKQELQGLIQKINLCTVFARHVVRINEVEGGI